MGKRKLSRGEEGILFHLSESNLRKGCDMKAYKDNYGSIFNKGCIINGKALTQNEESQLLEELGV